jgi:hypothetical protein
MVKTEFTGLCRWVNKGPTFLIVRAQNEKTNIDLMLDLDIEHCFWRGPIFS